MFTWYATRSETRNRSLWMTTEVHIILLNGSLLTIYLDALSCLVFFFLRVGSTMRKTLLHSSPFSPLSHWIEKEKIKKKEWHCKCLVNYGVRKNPKSVISPSFSCECFPRIRKNPESLISPSSFHVNVFLHFQAPPPPPPSFSFTFFTPSFVRNLESSRFTVLRPTLHMPLLQHYWHPQLWLALSALARIQHTPPPVCMYSMHCCFPDIFFFLVYTWNRWFPLFFFLLDLQSWYLIFAFREF